MASNSSTGGTGSAQSWEARTLGASPAHSLIMRTTSLATLKWAKACHRWASKCAVRPSAPAVRPARDRRAVSVSGKGFPYTDQTIGRRSSGGLVWGDATFYLELGPVKPFQVGGAGKFVRWMHTGVQCGVGDVEFQPGLARLDCRVHFKIRDVGESMSRWSVGGRKAICPKIFQKKVLGAIMTDGSLSIACHGMSAVLVCLTGARAISTRSALHDRALQAESGKRT